MTMSTTDQRYWMSTTTTDNTVANITWATYTPPQITRTSTTPDYYEAMQYKQQAIAARRIEGDIYKEAAMRAFAEYNSKQSQQEDSTMILYNVYMIYAEDRKKPVVKRVDGVLAKNDEDAKVKSGLMKEVDEAWDSDYLTFICERIGEVKVKPRPTEVKSV